MTQRIMYAMAAGVAAFVLVVIAALGAYMLMGAPANATAFASQGSTNAFQATGGQSQSDLPQPPGTGLGSSGSGIQDGYAVSSDQAANIALSSVPGATVMRQPRLVNFNGTVAYEVALDRGFVYVDAQSGQVLYNGANGTQGRPRPRFRR